jgi:hypothetical protein
MVHGVAKLAITGRFPFSSKTEVLKFAEYIIENSLPTVPAVKQHISIAKVADSMDIASGVLRSR